MGLKKKDEQYILRNYPARGIEELARSLGVKPAEVRAVLQAAGRLRAEVRPSEPLLQPCRVHFLGVMLLITAVSTVYLNSIRNGFHYDDIHSLLQNPGVAVDLRKNPASVQLFAQYFVDPTLFSSRPGVAMPRPVLMCTFGLNYMLSALWCDRLEDQYNQCREKAGARAEEECGKEQQAARSCIRGFDPRGWILVNILLHLLNACIIYVGLCHLYGRHRTALLTALLFALHPIATETVNYINCRSESLAVLFMLLSIYFFSRALLEERMAKAAVFAGAFALMYVIGLLTKELGFVTLGLLLAIDVLFIIPAVQQRRRMEPREVFPFALSSLSPLILGGILAFALYLMYIKKVLPPLLEIPAGLAVLAGLGWLGYHLWKTSPLRGHLLLRLALYSFTAAAMIGYMVYRQAVLDTLVVEKPVRDFKDNLVTQAGVVVSYVRLLFYPIQLNISYENTTILRSWKGLADPFLGPRLLFFLGLAGIAAADGFFGFWRRRPAVGAFAIALFFVTLSITSLVPLNALKNEHRLYLVSLGPCLLLAGLLSKSAEWLRQRKNSTLDTWPWPVQMAGIALIVFFVALTVQRNFSWHTDLTVWRDSITKSPLKAQVVSDLGNAYFRGGGSLVEEGEFSLDKKIDVRERMIIYQTFRETIPLGEITPETRERLNALYLKGLKRAEQLYFWAIRAEIDYYKAWHNLGTINFTYASFARTKAKSRAAAELLPLMDGLASLPEKINGHLAEAGKKREEAEQLRGQAAAVRAQGQAEEAESLEKRAEELTAEADAAEKAATELQETKGMLEEKIGQIQREIVAEFEQAENHLTTAASFFEAATRISPNGESFNDRGSSLLTLTDIVREKAGIQGVPPDEEKIHSLLVEALKQYYLGMRYNPELAKAYINYATTLVRSARTPEEERTNMEKALPYFDKAIAINPVDPRPYLIKGRYLRGLGRGREAAEAFTQCLRLSPAARDCSRELEELKSSHE